MATVFVTRKIPDEGLAILRTKGYGVDVSHKDGVLGREELRAALSKKPYDGVLCLLTDTIDSEIFDAAPRARIFANYAVGFNNIDVAEAKRRGIVVTNTPGVLTDTVAEHAFALLLSIAHRIAEADAFTRAGEYKGWAPELFLGTDVRGKALGILGAGRIGSRVADQGKRGFDMKILYYDVERNGELEKALGARFLDTPESILREADFISLHVPLLDATRHLVNAERLSHMKRSAYLINTSRGAVVDEAALVKALQNRTIRGAALDVFEDEPKLATGLAELPNVILTPHIASGTEETRSAMSRLAAENLISFFEGRVPPNALG